MLEQFKIPADDQVRVPEQSLRRTVTAIFEKMDETPSARFARRSRRLA